MPTVYNDPKTGKRAQARTDDGRFAAGESVLFSGKSTDESVIGTMPVKVIVPHSNAHLVTSIDKSGRSYEGAARHIPTATVERAARTGNFPSPAKQFDAFHHTLSKIG
jgi:hypothetical protein